MGIHQQTEIIVNSYLSVADLGGGGQTRAPPPPLKPLFKFAPPFLYMCPPPLLKIKDTEMCRNTEMFRIPPPRLGLARLSTLVALQKSVGAPPPPPPALISFLGTCVTLDAGGSPKKACRILPPAPQVCCAPFFLSWIRPWYL